MFALGRRAVLTARRSPSIYRNEQTLALARRRHSIDALATARPSRRRPGSGCTRKTQAHNAVELCCLRIEPACSTTVKHPQVLPIMFLIRPSARATRIEQVMTQ
jgi:hypothetical protein